MPGMLELTVFPVMSLLEEESIMSHLVKLVINLFTAHTMLQITVALIVKKICTHVRSVQFYRVPILLS